MPLRLSNPDAVKGKTSIILLPGYKQEALCLGLISAEFGVEVRVFFFFEQRVIIELTLC